MQGYINELTADLLEVVAKKLEGVDPDMHQVIAISAMSTVLAGVHATVLYERLGRMPLVAELEEQMLNPALLSASTEFALHGLLPKILTARANKEQKNEP